MSARLVDRRWLDLGLNNNASGGGLCDLVFDSVA
jgi:hypothetical protein